MVPKENILTYSTQFVFFITKVVPGNVVMVAIDMCEKRYMESRGYIESRENMCILIFQFILL